MDAIAYLVGAGSMSLGIEQAGFNIREVWETPDYAQNARTWTLNRPSTPARVLELDHQSDHFVDRQVDLIYGNPPCGGVSSMGTATCENPTNACMRHWIRMVVKGKPRFIIMESGWQLDSERFARLLRDLTNVLDEHGYWWWTWRFFSYQVGTPQRRRRMFLCASLEEPKNDELLDLADLQGVRPETCRPYLELLKGVEPSPEPVVANNGQRAYQHWWIERTRKGNPYLAGRRQMFRDGYVTPKQLETWRRMAEKDPGKHGRAYEANKAKLWADCPPELNFSQFFTRLLVLDYDTYAPTMIAVDRFVHPEEDRVLTLREMALLMGYPLDWQFHQLRTHFAIQGVPVGNGRWVADRLLKVVGMR